MVSSEYSELVEEHISEVLSVVPMSRDTWDAVNQGMKMVCDTGTASPYFRGYSLVDVSGKTGTAEHGSGGSNHGAFVCYAPADNPEIAIVVYVEKAGVGGYLANVARAILDVYFTQETGSSEMVTYENRVG